MKKLLCIIIAAVMLTSAVALTAYADGAYNVNAYGPESGGSDTRIAPGETAGIRLHMNAPFNALSVRLSTYLKKDTVATVSLYKWADDFEDTLKTTPLATKVFNPVNDNLKHDMSFAEQPAGEYLIGVRNDKSELCIWAWKNTNEVGKGLLYINGAENAFDTNVTVTFTKNTDEPFVKVTPSAIITGKNKAPDEYVPSNDSAVVKRAAHPTTWEATDELGRTLPTYAETGGLRDGKTVALFYWSWHVSQANGEPLNVQKVMDEHPEAKNDYNSSVWPTGRTVHFWNESIYGYYKTNDKWVLRHHAELLADAGVDVIFFDNTNGTFTFRDSYTYIYETFAEALEDGVNVPKISFLLPFGDEKSTMTQLSMLYQDIYLREKYQQLWFYWEGKPMVMAHKNFISGNTDIAKEMRGYFTFRGGQPGYLVSKTSYDTWGWLSTYPQATYKSKSDKNAVEQMTVGVAVNHNYVKHAITAMNGENVIGRTYTSKGVDTRENAAKYGANFAEQFDYALKVDPKVIFITGWNEWIAGRYKVWPENGAASVENAFPDEFNDEFSRDIEPSKGRLRDNYYYQMVSYIRKFKGCEENPVYKEYKTINIDGSASQWDDVDASYIAYKNNISDRDADGYGSYHYTDKSGRNDIIGAKVARDAEYIYFTVECANKITPYTGKNWMQLYIDVSDDPGWETFDYVIGKKPYDSSSAYLQKFTGNGYGTKDVGKASYKLDGKHLTVAVKKADFGITERDYKICFKWTDNVSDEDGSGEFKGEILDFYRTGDVAPGGRFKYVYTAHDPESPVSTVDTEQPGTTAETEQPGTTAEENATSAEDVTTVPEEQSETAGEDVTTSGEGQTGTTVEDATTAGEERTDTDSDADIKTDADGPTDTSNANENGNNTQTLIIVICAAVAAAAVIAAVAVVIKRKKK